MCHNVMHAFKARVNGSGDFVVTILSVSRMGQSRPPPPGPPNTGRPSPGRPSRGRCYPDEADTTKPSIEMIAETFNLLFSPKGSRVECITSCRALHP